MVITSLKVKETLSKTFHLLKNSYRHLLHLMILVWGLGFVSHFLVKNPSVISPNSKWLALGYLGVMVVVTASSAWAFQIIHAVEKAEPISLRQVFREVRSVWYRYVVFYSGMMFVMTSIFFSGKLLSEVVGWAGMLFFAIAAAVYVLLRVSMALPMMAFGQTLFRAIKDSWVMSYRRVSFLLMHLLFLCVFLLVGIVVLAAMQTLGLTLYVIPGLEQHTLLLQASAGLSVFFTLPLIHVYWYVLWQSCQQQQGSELCSQSISR